MAKLWKKGRGKLGCLQPLLGEWVAESDSPMGPLRCVRRFESILGGACVQLDVRWEFKNLKQAKEKCDSPALGSGPYKELAIFAPGDDGDMAFWSFTSDGKRSRGKVAIVTDLHPEAVGFEAQMKAGLARMAYWPASDGGFHFVVEAKSAKGWKRFVDHHYRAVAS